MLNKSVIAILLLIGLVLVSFSTIGKFDAQIQLASYYTVTLSP